ncbi:hypothetical protein Tco_1192999 [Tanacetum coccineum]
MVPRTYVIVILRAARDKGSRWVMLMSQTVATAYEMSGRVYEPVSFKHFRPIKEHQSLLLLRLNIPEALRVTEMPKTIIKRLVHVTVSDNDPCKKSFFEHQAGEPAPMSGINGSTAGWSGLRGGLGGAAVDVIVVVGSGDAEVSEVEHRIQRWMEASKGNQKTRDPHSHGVVVKRRCEVAGELGKVKKRIMELLMVRFISLQSSILLCKSWDRETNGNTIGHILVVGEGHNSDNILKELNNSFESEETDASCLPKLTSMERMELSTVSYYMNYFIRNYTIVALHFPVMSKLLAVATYDVHQKKLEGTTDEGVTG